MQVILNPPMTPQRLGIAPRTHPPAADEITHLRAALAVDRPLAAAHAHGRQPRPQPPVADAGHMLDHHTRPFLVATVAVLARRVRPHFPCAAAAEPRSVLPSMAIWPTPTRPATPRSQARQQRSKARGSRAAKTRSKVSWLGTPCGSFKKRRNQAARFWANRAMSGQSSQ